MAPRWPPFTTCCGSWGFFIELGLHGRHKRSSSQHTQHSYHCPLLNQFSTYRRAAARREDTSCCSSLVSSLSAGCQSSATNFNSHNLQSVLTHTQTSLQDSKTTQRTGIFIVTKDVLDWRHRFNVATRSGRCPRREFAPRWVVAYPPVRVDRPSIRRHLLAYGERDRALERHRQVQVCAELSRHNQSHIE